MNDFTELEDNFNDVEDDGTEESGAVENGVSDAKGNEQCQECGQLFEDIHELTKHVQSNHIVRRVSSSKSKAEKKPGWKQTIRSFPATPTVIETQPVVLRVYECGKCGCEMSSSEFNEIGMCTSCLVKVQLEVVCDESSLMMTCESFCEVAAFNADNDSDVENALGAFDKDNSVEYGEKAVEDDSTDIKNVELEEMSGESVFEVSHVAEAYARIGTDKSIRYRCLICSREFVRHKSMRKHMLTHVDIKPFSCDICGIQFTQVEELDEHISTQHCDAEDRDQEEQSQTEAAKKTLCACGQCGKQFQHRASLFRHLETHENLRFDCAECGKTYRHRADFQQHMRLKHLLKNRAVCRYCDRQFYLPGSLRAHLHVHRSERSYKCRLCDKVYQRSDSLNSHMLSHTGESPYMCTQCGEQFKHRLSMYRHLDSHKDRELFRCELCSRCFKHSNALKEHKKRFHTPESLSLIHIISQADVMVKL